MSARFVAADLLAAPIAKVRDNRRLVEKAAGLATVGGPSTDGRPTVHREHEGAPPWRDPLLLAVLGEARRLPRLEGEDALQALIVHNAREAARAGRWHVMCVMCRNDVRVRRASRQQLAASPALAAWDRRQEREAQREGGRAKAMGLQPGWPDLAVIWAGGVGYLECKMPGSYPSPEQRAVHALLRAWGHRVETVRSWDETLAVWQRWGVPGCR